MFPSVGWLSGLSGISWVRARRISYSITIGCGGRIRTVYDDLKVMSLASYQTALLRYVSSMGDSNSRFQLERLAN